MTPQIRALDDLDGEPHANPFPDSEPKTVRLTLAEGDRIPPHRHPDRDIVCHVTSGRIELTLGDETVILAAGEVARFDGDQDISPAALEDSAALLVLAER